jgi:hypothetical protein
MQQDDLFAKPPAVRTAQLHAERFTADFLAFLPDNLHVYEAFEREALTIARRGWKHYSARTILHVLRHHSAVAEVNGEGWKLNNNISPYLARLFVLMNPLHAGLFEFREAKAAGREAETA